MVQEDQNQVCSDISNNVGFVGMNRSSSSSKKLKQKKVPQRGLGVAQLEKIRIEEQEKKDTPNTTNTNTTTNISSTLSTLSPSLTSLTLNTASPFPNYQLNKTSKSSNHITPSPPLSNLPSPNPIFRSCTFPEIDTFNIGSIPSLNVPTNGRGFNGGWSPMPTNVNVSFPMPTNGNGNMNVNFPLLGHAYEFSHGSVGENSRLDHHGLMFRSNSSLPYESCPIPPLPDLEPKRQQYHQPPNSLMYSSSMNHSSSSTTSFHTEPPSNQSYCSNYSPLWPDEEKIMVGMKRSRPFGKYPTLPSHSTSRSDKSTIYHDNGGTSSNFDPTIPIFREVPSCHSAMFELPNSKKSNRLDNGNYSNEDFLTLPASPTVAPPFPSSRLNQPSTFQPPRYREFLNFESLPYRGTSEVIVVDSRTGGSNKQLNSFFNFFPSTKTQVVSASTSTGHSSHHNSEVGESVDLNLRL